MKNATWRVKCMKCEVRSAKCGVRRVQCEVWRKGSLGVALQRDHAGHVLGQQHGNSFAQSRHTRAWLAHGTCKFYRWERSYSITLRQLPPRLVRVLLVLYIIYHKTGDIPEVTGVLVMVQLHPITSWDPPMKVRTQNWVLTLRKWWKLETQVYLDINQGCYKHSSQQRGPRNHGFNRGFTYLGLWVCLLGGISEEFPT
jgi:hypothetical protein